MLQFVHITDLHADASGMHFGIDAFERLELALSHAAGHAPHANFAVLTGDVAERGDEASYRKVRRMLERLPYPAFVLPGNHDDPSVLSRVFEETPSVDLANASGARRVRELRAPEFNALFLDTHAGGKGEGAMKTGELDAIREALRSEKHLFLFMHHPPFITGMGAMDEPYENVDRLRGILEKAPWVRLCCGHMHRPIFTQWAGVTAVTAPAASMQIDLDLSPEGGDTFRMEMPGYMLHHWDGSHLNSHVCQIHATPSFAGPYRFLDSVNPVEDD